MKNIIKFLILLFIVTSCTFSNQKLTRIKLSLDYFLNPYHATLIIGIEKGFFKKYGIEIEILENIGSSQGCIYVDQKATDFAVVIEPQVYIQQNKKLQIKHIASLVHHNLEALVSHIPVNQLKGKRIGHASSGNGFTNAVIHEVLSSQSLSKNNVELIYSQKDLKRLFLVGFVDVITNVYYHYEVDKLMQFSQNDKKKLYVYSLSEFQIPSFHSLVIITHKTMQNNFIKKFLLALKESNDFLLSISSQESWNILVQHKKDLNTTINQKAWKRILSLLRGVYSSPSKSHKKNIISFLKKHSLI